MARCVAFSGDYDEYVVTRCSKSNDKISMTGDNDNDGDDDDVVVRCSYNHNEI